MQIYLMRHAEAVPGGEWRGGDASRPLSKRGRAALEKALPFISKSHLSVKKIICSPFLRTVETAELLSSVFNLSPHPVAKLASGATIALYRETIRAEKENNPLFIVGHMPDLAVAAAHVTNSPSMMEANVQPGDILSIETGEIEPGYGNGKLLWQKKLEDWAS